MAIRTRLIRHRVGAIQSRLKTEAQNGGFENNLSSHPDDNRIFLEINVFGHKILSLLDCGATKCVIGGAGLFLIEKCGLKTYKADIEIVSLADGRPNKVTGQVDLPIILAEKTFLISAYVVPAIDQPLILGLNFWHTTRFIPDVSTGTWTLSQNLPQNEKVGGISDQDGDKLLYAEREKLQSFIAETKQKFPTGLGRTHILEHVIDTGDAKPIKCKQRYVAPPQLQLLQEKVDELLAMNVIEEANSPWCSPVFMVNEAGKSPRFVTDMRQVNSVTIPDAYGIESMNSILDNLGEFKFISTIDFKKSYWQVALSPESRPKTAFYVPGRGQFQYLVVPFGAVNSGPGWMRVIDKVLANSWIRKYVKTYVDDGFVGTPTLELHFKVLEELFRLLLEHNLTPNWEKCKFLRTSYKILGYVLDEQGLHPDPDKVASILKLERPRNPTEVRKFLGTTSYYRRFIDKFSAIAEPLSRLTQKKRKFEWQEEQEIAYKTILQALVSDAVIRLPDFSRKFYLSTDASDVGISGVLTQKFDDGEHLVHCVSRVLTPTEQRYPTIHKEALAIIWSIEKLEGYLAYGRFGLKTDCKPLKFMFDSDCPKGRAGNWIYRLQKYDIDPEHIPGKDNNLPDFASRFTAGAHCSAMSFGRRIKDLWYLDLIDKVEKNPNKYPLFHIESGKLFKIVKSRLPWEDSSYKQVIPKEYRQKVLEENHCKPETGHFGFYKTLNRISENFYWPKMRHDISKFLASCQTCKEQKPSQSAPAGLMSSHMVDEPWQVVCSDLVGELPRSSSGFTWVLTQVDLFTKYVILTPMRDGTAKSVCAGLQKSVLTFGAPELWIQDNAQIYNSGQFRDLAKRHEIRLQYTPRHHPQANPAERVNRVFETIIRSFVSENQKDWDKFLPEIAFAINSSAHETTRFTPNFLFFSRNLSLTNFEKPRENNDCVDPISNYANRLPRIKKIHELVREKIAASNKRQAHHYNLRHRPSDFKVGDKVMKRNWSISKKGKGFTAKLDRRFFGPFTLTAQDAANMFTLADKDGREIGSFDTKDLKKD